MATNVADLGPPFTGAGLRLGVKRLREFFGFDRDPLKWTQAGEGDATLQYLGRLDHLLAPDPCEGEIVSGPNPCFLVRSYAGKREVLWVDTEASEINPLCFLATYKDSREYWPDLEIGTPRQY